MIKQVTVYDVAREARVSIKTVSRVVNQENGVSPAMRRRVLEVVAKLGYVQNAAARSLVTRRSDTIGVVIDSIADPFFATLVSVVEARALFAGYSVLIASTGRSAQRERDHVRRLTQKNVCGLLLAPTMSSHDYLAEAVGTVPVVLIDRGWPLSGFDTVRVDDQSATRAAIEHLLSFGHRRIAFVGDVAELTTTVDRRAGYLDALRGAGIPIADELVCYQLQGEDPAGDAVRTLLALPDPPTAMLSSNARATLGVIHALVAARRTDVAVVSFGDFALAQALDPAITVVDHDPGVLAAAATERLLARIRGEQPVTADIVMPVSLIRRGSGELPPRLPPHAGGAPPGADDLGVAVNPTSRSLAKVGSATGPTPPASSARSGSVDHLAEPSSTLDPNRKDP